jgi:hypothetical protein
LWLVKVSFLDMSSFAAVGSQSTASSIGSHRPRVANDVS